MGDVNKTNKLMEQYVKGDLSLVIYAEKDRSRAVASCLITLIEKGHVTPDCNAAFVDTIHSIHLLTDVDERALTEWAYAVDDPEYEFSDTAEESEP